MWSGPDPAQRTIRLRRENDPLDLEPTPRMRGGVCFAGLLALTVPTCHLLRSAAVVLAHPFLPLFAQNLFLSWRTDTEMICGRLSAPELVAFQLTQEPQAREAQAPPKEGRHSRLRARGQSTSVTTAPEPPESWRRPGGMTRGRGGLRAQASAHLPGTVRPCT